MKKSENYVREDLLCPKCGSNMGELIKKDGKLIEINMGSLIMDNGCGHCAKCKLPFKFTSSNYFISGNQIEFGSSGG
jgi:hypothetical protein